MKNCLLLSSESGGGADYGSALKASAKKINRGLRSASFLSQTIFLSVLFSSSRSESEEKVVVVAPQ